MNMQKSLRHTMRHTPKKGLVEKIKDAVTKQAQNNLSTNTADSPSLLKCCDEMLHGTKSLHKRPHRPTSQTSYVSKSSPPRKRASLALPLGVAAVGAGICLSGSTKITVPPVCYAREYDEDTSFKPKTRLDWLFEVCKKGDTEKLQKLISEGQNINEKHEFGWTALMVAVANKQNLVVELLLENGANPDLQDDFTLMSGSKEDNVFNFREIHLKQEARFSSFPPPFDADVVFVGCSALHYAVLCKNKDALCLLYKYGADSSLKNTTGMTAQQMALTSDVKQLIKDCEQTREKHMNPEIYKKKNFRRVLETELVGQQLAIEQVTSIVTRMENGWINDKHPMVLLFVGGTGLGKTEMAKILAQYLRGDEKDSFLHINLSDYQMKDDVAKFIGAPPGYVGYGSSGEGALFNVLSKNQRAIVLFDEADKAHSDVLSTLLQLFDEGRLTSGSGKTLDCCEAVFVLAANLATESIKKFGTNLREKYDETSSSTEDSTESAEAPESESVGRDKYIHDFQTKLRHDEFKEAFKRDEFLGRINEVAIFIPFSTQEKQEMIVQQLGSVKSMAATRHGVSLSWDERVLDILEKAFNETYGARNMKYEIDRQVVSKLSQAEESGLYKPGDFMHLQADHLFNDGKTRGKKFFKTGNKKTSEERRYIRLYKVSPLGEKENLDIQFADLTDLYSTKIY